LRRGTHAPFLTQHTTQRRKKWEINRIKQHRSVQKLSTVTFRFSVQMAEYIKILRQQQCDFNNQFSKTNPPDLERFVSLAVTWADLTERGAEESGKEFWV